MILGFLGKGGSGKTSVATQMTLWLHARGKNILAIDADHNMDLAFNLSHEQASAHPSFLGNGLADIQGHIGLLPQQKYSEAFTKNQKEAFSFSPDGEDSFTKKYSSLISKRLRLMSSGPQTEQVLYGKSCSHILTTPLKVYLPLLKLEKDDVAVVDEKAGADGVTTGIVTGIDVAIIVFEPAVHGMKTAMQIAELLNFYNTPHIFVANKVISPQDLDFISLHLKDRPVIHLPSHDDVRRNPGKPIPAWDKRLSEIYDKAAQITNNDRLARTQKKFERNARFHPDTASS